MATKRMLVDAIHPEETRIVVTSGNRLEEFDFESASRRQLRGNIYLAKVTRVEPSLQAAFVEYGGNRHGFLAFSEIHPDYYQIPVADREALLRDEESESVEEPIEDTTAEPAPADAEDEADTNGNGNIEQAPANSEPVESVGGADALEEVARPARKRFHKYKIQEVIKRRQVMLVQVVKEERGNKGAALTTYLSLAGRYSVLMPNTARGGGISRKITNAADRKRLKEITSDLEVPQGMGVILRTAGASRTKAEVKRDFEYLMRLWENVRSLTLKSQAPCLVYEEGSLIKRTIRDLYNKDIDEVYVAGENAHREARDFMRMIMPSHAKNVQLYKDDQPLFSKYNIEGQLDQMFSPQVTLPSGGYIVINPTEALVSIDVNSGRATKEHSIEDTAVQTNLEAAEEISRQLRLRDLAGLIVIDFIDMLENRSNRAVERKLKECLKNDRARIQVGRISHFGLMEMSRQRIRFGVLESSTHKCPVCEGTGLVRSTESLALMIMRQIEDHLMRRSGQSINVRMPVDVALYILNTKRETLSALEARYGLSITVTADGKMAGSQYAIEKGEARLVLPDPHAASHVRVDTAIIEDDADEDIVEDEDEDETAPAAATAEAEGEPRGRRRRRRGRRGGERNGEERVAAIAAEADAEDDEPQQAASETGDDEEKRKRRRRGRRGGRRNRRPEDAVNGETADTADGAASAETDEEAVETVAESLPLPEETADAQDAAAEASAEEVVEKPKRRRTRKTAAAEAEPAEGEAVAATTDEAPAEKPKRKPRARKPKADAVIAEASGLAEAIAEEPAAEEPPLAEVADERDNLPDEAPEPAEAEAAPEAAAPPSDEIVVSSTVANGDEPKKKRAGWWQRGLLGR